MESLTSIDPSALCAAIMEAAPDAFLLVDSKGRIVLTNRQAERLFGYPRAELVGQPVELLVPDQLRSSHFGSRATYMASPRTRTMGEAGRLSAQCKDGTIRPVSVGLSTVSVPEGRFIICIIRDETATRKLEEELWRRSTTDELTGVYNRAFFDAELHRLKNGRRFPVSVIVADIDGLKPTNDMHGHAAGDNLLRRTGAVLRTTFRREDVVARIGGDEFGVLLPEVGAAGLEDAVRRLTQDLARHNEVFQGPELYLSFGGATAFEAAKLRSALRVADARMYEHKRRHGHGGRPRTVNGEGEPA